MNNNLTLIFHLYKNTKSLDKSIKSILTQTDKNFELIIIDDDSTQDVTSIISKNDINALNIKFLSFSENFGHSFSFNYAIKHATNNYVYYFGSNVHLEPNFVELINQKISENKNADVFSFDLTPQNKNDASIKVLHNIKDMIENDVMVQIKDKVLSKNFLVKNKIGFTPFKHYSLLFFVNLLKSNPKWVHINKNIVSVSTISSYSYNLYDTSTQIDEIIRNFIDPNSYESRNRTEIGYYVILTLLYTFIIKIFRSKPNNGFIQSAVIKEAYTKLNTSFPQWRNNPYLNSKNNPTNPKILHYLNSFKPYRYFVRILLLRGKI